MTPFDIALIGAGGFAAGAVNAMAGGGTFFSFPAMLAVGLPPVTANASNSVALWPGSLTGVWAYRHELAQYKRYLVPMSVMSLIGGALGGWLLKSGGYAAVLSGTSVLVALWLVLGWAQSVPAVSAPPPERVTA